MTDAQHPEDAIDQLVPQAYLQGLRGISGPFTEVLAREAAWLVAQPQFEALYQRSITNPRARAMLNQMKQSASVFTYRVSRRKEQRNDAEVVAALVVMNTKQAAEAAGVTQHAIRLAIRDERLRAHKSPSGHWQVLTEDVHQYRNHRRGAAA